MTPRGRRIFWAAVWLVVVVAHRVLTVHLAGIDPIAGALTGKLATTGLLLLGALVCRFLLFVVAPVWLAVALVAVSWRFRGRLREARRSPPSC